MKTTGMQIDLIEELKKIREGKCIWCEMELDHPAHSQCPQRHPALDEFRTIAKVTAPEEQTAVSPADSEIARFGKDGEYVLRMAVEGSDRLKCWHLVYKEYLAHGYTERKELEYRYSIHDALPDTATFLIEKNGEPVGTVSVFPDSPVGLPADEIYRAELDAMRKAGRSLTEVGRLTICEEHKNEREILVNLFDALSSYARHVRQATDLIITVNPSHAKFYERMILFDRVGAEKDLGSVCGAPAVLLNLDLDREEMVRRFAHGEGPKPDGFEGGRTMYPMVSGLAEEQRRVGRMIAARRRLPQDFLKRYFVRLRPLIPNLPSPLQYFFEKCYPDYRLLSGGLGS